MGQQGYPGGVADSIGGGLINGVKGIVSGIAGGIEGAGEAVQQGLDKPAEALRLRHSPFRIIDDVLDGTVRSVKESINDGLADPTATFFSKVTDGLDKVPDTFVNIGQGGGLKPPPFPTPPGRR